MLMGIFIIKTRLLWAASGCRKSRKRTRCKKKIDAHTYAKFQSGGIIKDQVAIGIRGVRSSRPYTSKVPHAGPYLIIGQSRHVIRVHELCIEERAEHFPAPHWMRFSVDCTEMMIVEKRNVPAPRGSILTRWLVPQHCTAITTTTDFLCIFRHDKKETKQTMRFYAGSLEAHFA